MKDAEGCDTARSQRYCANRRTLVDEDVQPTVYRVTFLNQVDLRSLLDGMVPVLHHGVQSYQLQEDAKFNVWNENLTQLVEMVNDAT